MQVILFDLDGTMLPMDQDKFTERYFSLLAKKLMPYGYQPEELIKAIWAGTKAMVCNDGTDKNETVFWNKFQSIYGDKVKEHKEVFDEFYERDFIGAKDACGYHPKAQELVAYLKSKGYRLAFATNPIFPETATRQRILWAGLNPEDFEWITTYENSTHCKPNPSYYIDICNQLGVSPKECLMIGNDVTEDMVAETIGMRVFLLTDCLINKEKKDISAYAHGDFSRLREYLIAMGQ